MILKKYDIIYADPPWNIKKINRNVRPNQVEMDYPTMPISEIKSLRVQQISKENSVCFLWTTQKYLPLSFSVLEAWGFKYQRMVTWDKRNGMCLFGFHHRTEFLLFGYRGKIEIFPKRKAFPTLVECKTDKHSKKPQVFRDWIALFGRDRIELFARNAASEGWDVWGNEVESDESITKALTGQAG